MNNKVHGEGFGIPFDYTLSNDGRRIVLTGFDNSDVQLVQVPIDGSVFSEVVSMQKGLVMSTELLGFIVRHFAKHDPKSGRTLLNLHIPGEA